MESITPVKSIFKYGNTPSKETFTHKWIALLHAMAQREETGASGKEPAGSLPQSSITQPAFFSQRG